MKEVFSEPPVRNYSGDYNGTFGQIGQPLSPLERRTLEAWMHTGNTVAFNTSDNRQQGTAKGFGDYTNGPFVGELGGNAYRMGDKKDELAVFHALSDSELTAAGDAIVRLGMGGLLRSVAYLPRYDRGDNHGVSMYMDPKVGINEALDLLGRYPSIHLILRDPQKFASFLPRNRHNIAMITFRANPDHLKTVLETLESLQVAQDTSGGIYVTKRGVDKRTTLLEIEDMYRDHGVLLDETFAVGGDSPGTDGPLFQIPDVTKIAVRSRRLFVPDVPGRNIYRKSPEGTRRLFAGWVKEK